MRRRVFGGVGGLPSRNTIGGTIGNQIGTFGDDGEVDGADLSAVNGDGDGAGGEAPRQLLSNVIFAKTTTLALLRNFFL